MLSDERLVQAAQAGDSDAMTAIVARYENAAIWVCEGFYSHSAERDDLHQEARIGLFKAVRDYRPEHGATFKSFVFLCTQRQLFTAVKSATRGKHELLTWATRAAVNEEGEEVAAIDTVPDPAAGAAEILDLRGRLATIVAIVATIKHGMSPLERESVLGVCFRDESYAEVEERIGGFDAERSSRAAYNPVKVVDNALSRARLKLRRALEEGPPVPLGQAA